MNQTARGEDRPVSSRYDSRSQTLLLTACPLSGPIAQLTGWTMTRVFTFAGRAYWQLMAGLGVLLASVLAAATLLARLTLTWSRHVSRIETALAAHDIATLPALGPTGERELDRIITALNEAGRRLAEGREHAEQLSKQVAAGERLAAIGRVAAGLAHEIRNPIAAMRLRAENAIAGYAERKREALSVILAQIERLDALVRRLLSATERDRPRRERVDLPTFMESCIAAHDELAEARGIALECTADRCHGEFDPERMRHALDNLILNAIQAAPSCSRIRVAAVREADGLVLAVHDEGAGPPPEIRDRLFEPFVTGRPDGTGLGLSVVREVAEAHGGTVRLAAAPTGTTFEIVLPWRLC